MLGAVSIKCLFPKAPRIRFRPSRTTCSCCTPLKVQKTRERCVKTLAIGTFCAIVTHLFCPSCHLTYSPQDLQRLVPEQSNVGYDVLAFIGKAFYQQARPQTEIQEALARRNVHLSLREIGYLGRKFVVYLSLGHQEAAEDLRQKIVSRGGYILHLDGTVEVNGKGPFLLTALDGITGMVLGNAKVASESCANFIPFLKRIKAGFGDPIALVHDMGAGLMRAVAQVFPKVPDFICHFHFLRDLGKDLLKPEYQLLSKQIKVLRIRPKLREAAHRLRQVIEADPVEQASLKAYLDTMPSPVSAMPPRVSAYLLIMWVLEVAVTLKGYGLPFDRVDIDFFNRLQTASPMIRKWLPLRKTSGRLHQLGLLLKRVALDTKLSSVVETLDQKTRDFDLFRDAMRIVLPNGPHGLNDEGVATDTTTIRKAVNLWCQLPHIKKLAESDPAYRKALKQINKYTSYLFPDPIEVKTPQGTIFIQPQRTNNIMERFFREFKRKNRKRSGFLSVGSVLNSMIANTPLVRNLENAEYRKVFLAGHTTLADRFAAIDVKKVRKQLAEHRNELDPGSTRLRRLAKIPDLPARLCLATLTPVAA